MSRDASKIAGVAEAVHSSAIRILRMVRVEDARAGIPPAQLSALSVLVFSGPCALGRLAVLEQVKPPTMSRIIQGLVEKRLVQRAPQAADRRSVRIAPTLKGKKLLLAGRKRRVRALTKRFEVLSNHDLSVLAKATQLLARI